MVRVDISSKEYRPFTFHQDFKIATQFLGYFLTIASISNKIYFFRISIGAYGSLQPRFSSCCFNLSISKIHGSERHPFNRA